MDFRMQLRNALPGQFLVTQNHNQNIQSTGKHIQSTSKAHSEYTQRTIKAQTKLSQSKSKAQSKEQVKLKQAKHK